MKPSQLVAIVRRLEAMKEDSGEMEVRRFEKDGVEKCVVRYDQESGNFELEETQTRQKYQFDDIDLVTIEVYDLLNG
ncbi:YkuJ family protein [Carnobacteriaceae bacterium zg-ZUI252]|nr:YkuJ family protein [Carnobacteriaceae bacterium zg-ZUI252]MBS4770233.1 YkuJ family protein [Carnobacteriaceae bacterium zg-ZUI240]QTU83409.1 YkuJ family protein [Carnobacteriaceae bacterium zg-C25]